MKFTISILAIAFWCAASTTHADAGQDQPVPLPRTHSHNDYEHPRPLFDALDHGFCSIEPDIHLINGQLLVAHDRSQAKPDRTLEKLYLDPLRQRIRQNGGRVYRDGPVLTLLIDIKTDADATYSALRNVLKNYADILGTFPKKSGDAKPVRVILSGNRPRKMLEAESIRFAALDGRPEDLVGNASSDLIPLISESWTRLFHWRGVGPFPDAEKRKLREIVGKAHAQGRQVRFWATPDRPAFWKELLDADVDLLNADDLAGLQHFLLEVQTKER